VLSVAGCSSTVNKTNVVRCQNGDVAQCVGSTGCNGVKACQANGTYGACECVDGAASSGGSGGRQTGQGGAAGVSGSGGVGTAGIGGSAGAGPCLHCVDAFNQGYHGDETALPWCSAPGGALWQMYNCACATTGCGDVGAACDANWCEGHQVPDQACQDCVQAVCGSALYNCQLD
jgi:hypothetical protein